MYKIVIVDDEPFIREGLESFPWRELGCMVIATAEDGDEGLELINRQLPDIIITDVRMPGMDGLEFSSLVKNKYPDIEIIVLTGYDDFSYAQSAVKIGVKDFLLKPTNFSELSATVKKLTTAIADRRVKQEEVNTIRKHMQKAFPLVKNKLISDLMHGYIYIPTIIKEWLDSFNINIEKYVIFSIQVDNSEGAQWNINNEDRLLYDFAIMNISEEIIRNYGKDPIFALEKNIMSALIPFSYTDSSANCLSSCVTICRDIQKAINSTLPFTASIGIGDVSSKIIEMNRAFVQSTEALNNRFFIGNSSLILYNDLPSRKGENYIFSEFDKVNIYNSLRAGSIENINGCLDKMKQEISNYQGNNISYIKSGLLEVILNSIRTISESNIGFSEKVFENMDVIKSIHCCMTLDELFEECKKLFVNIVQMLSNIGNEFQRSLISKIMKFMEENFHDDLSLDILAERYHLSTGYLSRLIKKETGRTFMEILTDIRISKAKSLLDKGIYKVNEIADMVGYKDMSYFIQVFKKQTGVTPNSYKELR
jgi:two-component system, response regulator YesN